jgi:hypothetical protein
MSMNPMKCGLCVFTMFAAAPLNAYASGDVSQAAVSRTPATTCAVSATVTEEAPQDPNAEWFGNGPWHISKDRKIWVGSKYQAGEQGNKVIWIRPAGIDFVITGRRLDGESTPLRVEVPAIYPWTFQVIAQSGSSELRFVTKVEPAAQSSRR